MKYPDDLPWKKRGICVYFDKVAGGFDICGCPDPENRAEYIAQAANLLPEMVEALEGLILITEHVALKDYTPVDKAKELLNKVKS